MVMDLGQDAFDREVLGSEVPVLLDFWGPQCKPCIALNPTVAALEEENAGRLKVVKVNAPDHRKLCVQLKVLGLPTFSIFRNGREVARLSRNFIGPEELVQWVGSNLGRQATGGE